MLYHIHQYIMSLTLFRCFCFYYAIFRFLTLYITKCFLLALPHLFQYLVLWPYITFFVWIIHPLKFLFNPWRLAQTFKCFIHNFWIRRMNSWLNNVHSSDFCISYYFCFFFVDKNNFKNVIAKYLLYIIKCLFDGNYKIHFYALEHKLIRGFACSSGSHG